MKYFAIKTDFRLNYFLPNYQNSVTKKQIRKQKQGKSKIKK